MAFWRFMRRLLCHLPATSAPMRDMLSLSLKATMPRRRVGIGGITHERGVGRDHSGVAIRAGMCAPATGERDPRGASIRRHGR